MKFISKQSNYRIVLRPGIPENRLVGTPRQPGLYVKFHTGMVNIEDKETIELMKKHRGYGTDFIQTEEDVFASQRASVEPDHNMATIEFGHIGKQLNPKSPVKLTPAQEKVIKHMAVLMATELIKDKNFVKSVLSEKVKEENTEEIVKEPINKKLTSPPPIEESPKEKLTVNDASEKEIKTFEEMGEGGVETVNPDNNKVERVKAPKTTKVKSTSKEKK